MSSFLSFKDNGFMVFSGNFYLTSLLISSTVSCPIPDLTYMFFGLISFELNLVEL
jgi:hypothetical protein